MPNQSRYPGTRPFLEEDRHLFFGRDHDKKKLSNLIVLEKLVVLFGKSGYGKSSLLNAGVIPYLRHNKHHFPIKIRFMLPDVAIKGPIAKPLEILKDHLELQIENIKKDLEQKNRESCFLAEKMDIPKLLPDDLTAILWYYIKFIQLTKEIDEATTLIFYQFEELFRYFNDIEVDEFGRSMAALLHPNPPDEVLELISKNLSSFRDDELDQLYEPLNLKVVFSVASDHLSLLNKLKRSLPEIFKYTYELKALNKLQAQKALEGPAQNEEKFDSPKFSFTKEAIDDIFTYLTKVKNKEGIEFENQDIETFQLQLIGQDAEEKIIAKKKKTEPKTKLKALFGKQKESQELTKFEFNRKDLGEPGNILKKFYKKVIDGLNSYNKRKKARNLIQNGLIIEGNRVPISGSTIKRDYKVYEDTLGILEDKHLLRSEFKLIDGESTKSYEISHFNLVKPIQDSVERRKQKRLWILVIILLFIIAGLIGWVGYLSSPSDTEGHEEFVNPKGSAVTIKERDSVVTKKEVEVSNGLIINAIATATALPIEGEAPLDVRLTFTEIKPRGEVRVVRYNWNFGDGTGVSNADSVLHHIYKKTGTYFAQLTVICTDSLEHKNPRTEDVKITVTEPKDRLPPTVIIQGDPDPPIAKASANPLSGEVPLTVAFTGSNANERGSDTQYKWDFGDGDTVNIANFERTFTEANTYDVKLTVTTNEISSDTIVQIRVNPLPPPVAEASALPISGDVPLTVSFKGSNANERGSDTHYEWDFGDGNTSKFASTEHTFTEVGSYDVELEINVDGVMSDTIIQITVKPYSDPPVVIEVEGQTWMERFIGIQEIHLSIDTNSQNSSDNWRIPPDSLNLVAILLPDTLIARDSTKDVQAGLLFFFPTYMKKGKFSKNMKIVKREVYKFPIEINPDKSNYILQSERFTVKSLIKQAKSYTEKKDTTIIRKFMRPDSTIVEYKQSTIKVLAGLFEQKNITDKTLNMYYTLFPYSNFDKTAQKESNTIYEKLLGPR